MSQPDYSTPPVPPVQPGLSLPVDLPAGPARISQACFVTWSRFDPDGLAAHKATRGGLVVRVPVPRQRWANRTMAD
jgi:hypothetical protein